MRKKLWKYMHEEHGLSLLESELNDIETIVYADLRKIVEKWEDVAGAGYTEEDAAIIWCAKEIRALLNREVE